MRIWVLLPVRSIATGKSRLAGVLDAGQRRCLNEHLVSRTLGVLAKAPGPPRTLVVSRCADVWQLARGEGFDVFCESGGSDLNEALRQGMEVAVKRGAEGVLILPCDLPLLNAHHIRMLLESARDGPAGITIVADRRGSGTNALLIVPPDAVGIRFGPGSFAAHVAAAQDQGWPVRILRSEDLAFDVDLPEDWIELRQRCGLAASIL